MPVRLTRAAIGLALAVVVANTNDAANIGGPATLFKHAIDRVRAYDKKRRPEELAMIPFAALQWLVVWGMRFLPYPICRAEE